MDYVGQAIIRTQGENGGRYLFAKPGKEYASGEEPDYIMTFGGMADSGETPQKAMLRELREEIAFASSYCTLFHAILQGDADAINTARNDILTEIEDEYVERLSRARAQGLDQVVTIVEGERDFKIQNVKTALDNLENPDKISQISKALALQSNFDVIIDRIGISLHMGDIPTIHVENFKPSEEQMKRGWYEVESHYYDTVVTEDEYALFKAILDTKKKLGITYEIAHYADLDEQEVRDCVTNCGRFTFYGTANALKKLLGIDTSKGISLLTDVRYRYEYT